MKLVSSASLIVGAALSLAACGQNNKSATKSAKKFPEQTAQKTVKKGGTLNYAIETALLLKAFSIVSCQSTKLTATSCNSVTNHYLIPTIITRLTIRVLPLLNLIKCQDGYDHC